MSRIFTFIYLNIFLKNFSNENEEKITHFISITFLSEKSLSFCCCCYFRYYSVVVAVEYSIIIFCCKTEKNYIESFWKHDFLFPEKLFRSSSSSFHSFSDSTIDFCWTKRKKLFGSRILIVDDDNNDVIKS